MRKALLAVLLFGVGAGAANAEQTDLKSMIGMARRQCGGISKELSDLKTMAGINTAVTSVGTAAGGVALGTGIAKAQTDNKLSEWKKKLLEKYEKEKNVSYTQIALPSIEDLKSIASLSEEDAKTGLKLEEKSKTLGNVRTGTLAANTVTNIVGTAIAAKNQVDDDLQTKIDSCVAAVRQLSVVLGQARIERKDTEADISTAQKIASECGMWETVNVSSINKRARGAAASSGVGTGIGVAGTIVSAFANSNNVRYPSTLKEGSDTGSGEADNNQREKNLNTTANVMAGTATAASLTATVFNASQISAIKRAADVAEKCEGALL